MIWAYLHTFFPFLDQSGKADWKRSDKDEKHMGPIPTSFWPHKWEKKKKKVLQKKARSLLYELFPVTTPRQ